MFRDRHALRARLRVTKSIDSRSFSMVLQWSQEYHIFLDPSEYPSSSDQLDAIVKFIDAACILGVEVEHDKGKISDKIKSLLSKDPTDLMTLQNSHIDLLFCKLENLKALEPVRDLFARAVAREYLAHRDDPHALEDELLYGDDAGPARRGVTGRYFRWDPELRKYTDLQQMLYRIIDATYRRREVMEKRKNGPAGLYFADPITGKMRLVYSG